MTQPPVAGSVPAKPRSVHPPARSAKDLALDDIVMATNSSSIVSKRSVEKLYYPSEPHFFHHFVGKFQRRSPLINRGYHLRLHVIDVAVRNFLRRASGKTKVVVNLGCGSDVLPWQCLTRYPEDCRGAKFIDVDFPDLLRKKCKIVQDTPELLQPLNNITIPPVGHILLTSDHYVQIGCDLRELAKVEESLAAVLDLPSCEFLFVAEVSITYMETEGADDVIKWAGSLGQVEFCLLEQILPDGPDHPFAKTMLQHFNNLKAAPKSVFVYPTLQAQRDRFSRLGWAHAEAKSLWQIWSGNVYLSAEDRRKLNSIEPFDEWEEFAIYAGHYCVVSARSLSASPTGIPTLAIGQPLTKDKTNEYKTIYHAYTGSRGQRRFGAPLKVQNTRGESCLCNIFGLGIKTRLRSQDIYGSHFVLENVEISADGPFSRMCHTAAELGQYSLICGGRASPSAALKDSWLLKCDDDAWSRTGDLPTPLYRHAMTTLGGGHSMALVIGGKTDSYSVFPGCLVYQPGTDWVQCVVKGTAYTPVFGAVLLSFPQAESEPGKLNFNGVLLGGMLEDGTVADQSLYWTVNIPEAPEAPSITFEPLVLTGRNLGRAPRSLANRFGAAGVVYSSSSIALIGGIIADELLGPDEEVLRIQISPRSSGDSGSLSGRVLEPARLAASSGNDNGNTAAIPRPLLVGVSVAALGGRNDDDDTASDLVIMGGGAVCFSMGSYWNEGCYVVQLDKIAASPAGADVV